jgi:hypothetical protein
VDLQVRRREGEDAAAERCPYCHDLIGAAAGGELVTCDGCGTAHHEACLAELGRCTIHGCGLAIDAAERERLEAERATVRERVRSRIGRAVQARSRDRAHSFTRGHCREAAVPRGMSGEDLVAAIRDAREAVSRREWERATQEYDEALRLLTSLGSHEVQVGERRVYRWHLEREATDAHDQLTHRAKGTGDLGGLALHWLAWIALTFVLAVPAWLFVSRYIL